MNKYRILAIEDEPVIVQLFRLNFELRGYEVLSCEASEDIPGRVREEKPDLIILDILMPGKNGWAVLKELKSDESTSSVPVVICSVMAKAEDRRKGREMGAFEYVTKPFDLRELVTVVEQAIGVSPVGGP